MDWKTTTNHPQGYREERKVEMDFKQSFLQIPPTFDENSGLMKMMMTKQYCHNFFYEYDQNI